MTQDRWPYRRPTQMKNDGCGVEDSEVRAVLTKPDASLGWQEFEVVFDPSREVGTYEETAYFVPWAFRYAAAHPRDPLEMLSGFVYFLSAEIRRLHADGLVPRCRRFIQELFAAWTERFEVVQLDEAACRAKGSR